MDRASTIMVTTPARTMIGLLLVPAVIPTITPVVDTSASLMPKIALCKYSLLSFIYLVYSARLCGHQEAIVGWFSKLGLVEVNQRVDSGSLLDFSAICTVDLLFARYGYGYFWVFIKHAEYACRSNHSALDILSCNR